MLDIILILLTTDITIRANLDIDVTRSTLLKINLGGRLEDTKEPNTKSNLFTFLTRVTPFGGAGLYDGKWIHTSPDNIGWDKGALKSRSI